MKTAEEFVSKWSNWWITNNNKNVLNRAFENELKEIIKQAQKEAFEIAFKEGQSNPKINRLEWERLNTTYYVDQYNPIGYRAKISEWGINNKKFILSLGLNDFSGAKIFDTLEEAKAFAQDDFEVRIKKCLITE